MSFVSALDTPSSEGVTLTIPESRLKAFRKAEDDQRWGQAFYDYMELHKITEPVNKAWCDKLYCAGFIDARKMVHSVLDRNN